MKKFIAIVMSLVLIASVAMLAGCGKKDDVKAAKVIGIDLTNENYAFGVDKAQPELLEKTNAFIDKILSNGTFDEICSRYSSGGEPVLVGDLFGISLQRSSEFTEPVSSGSTLACRLQVSFCSCFKK